VFISTCLCYFSFYVDMEQYKRLAPYVGQDAHISGHHVPHIGQDVHFRKVTLLLYVEYNPSICLRVCLSRVDENFSHSPPAPPPPSAAAVKFATAYHANIGNIFAYICRHLKIGDNVPSGWFHNSCGPEDTDICNMYAPNLIIQYC